ncbi:hypothetical protein EVAR_20265_1 [Eumeta japonica]|uniref:Uncharacterized protein n=1 Tax=Eumeta variegata TaxID=151549 RepID=A0A4C1VQL5_EUMVA|nr:hypothetical protein EVAR_20265_1 [Eumeta japonica]
METLATIDAPHQKNGTTGKSSRIQTSSRPLPRSTRHLQFARPRHVPRRNRTEETDRNPDSGARSKTSLHNILDLNTSLHYNQQETLITELATALTLAARLQPMRLPTFYDAHQRMAHVQSILRRHARRSPNTKHVKVEKSLRGKAKDAVGSTQL